MNRRGFLSRFGKVAAASAVVLSDTPTFGKNEVGEDVVSVPIVLTRAEVEQAVTGGSLPAFLRMKAASVRPGLLALHLANKGLIKPGHERLEMAPEGYWARQGKSGPPLGIQ